jgi:hypothetical protein
MDSVQIEVVGVEQDMRTRTDAMGNFKLEPCPVSRFFVASMAAPPQTACAIRIYLGQSAIITGHRKGVGSSSGADR